MKKIKYDKKEFQSVIQGFVIGTVLILMALYIPWAIKEINEFNRSIEAGYIVETTDSGYEIKQCSEDMTQIVVIVNDANRDTQTKAIHKFAETPGAIVRDFGFGEYTGKLYVRPVCAKCVDYCPNINSDNSDTGVCELAGYVHDAYIEKDGIKLYWVIAEFDYEEFIDSLSAIPELSN